LVYSSESKSKLYFSESALKGERESTRQRYLRYLLFATCHES